MSQALEDIAAKDDPSTSTSEIVAYRPEWHDEDIALVCGIANAGGGANSSDHCTTSKDVVQCTIADTQ